MTNVMPKFAPTALVSEATSSPPQRRRRRGAPGGSHKYDYRLAWLLVAPSILGFLVFTFYPVAAGIYYSFTDFRVLTPAEWIGLENYQKLVADPVFWHSLGVTVYFVALTVVFGILISLATAVVLHRLTKSTVIRGLIILPFLVSSVVAAVTWSWMLDAQLGIVNLVLEGLTGDTYRFLTEREWVIPSIAAISIWKSMGYTTILIFAGLQTIPEEVYEAGRMDGANEFRMFRSITLPLLRPILGMVVILTVIGAFQVFDIVQVATDGGPAQASNVLQKYIYDKAFGQFDFGYASAMSMVLFVMLLIITFTQMRLMRASESDTN
jgi:ABC-type sugar transport system permease subunit